MWPGPLLGRRWSPAVACGRTAADVALAAGERCGALFALDVSASTIMSDVRPQRAEITSHCGGALAASQLRAGSARAYLALGIASTGVITATPMATEVRRLVNVPLEAVRTAVESLVAGISVDGGSLPRCTLGPMRRRGRRVKGQREYRKP